MAHVELPQEELQPLIESMQKVFEPLMRALPSLTLIPDELSRIGDKPVSYTHLTLPTIYSV